MVGDLDISSLVISQCHEVSVQQRIRGNHVFKFHFEVCRHSFAEQVREPTTIFIIYQAISKHSLTLVIPQTNQVWQRLQQSAYTFLVVLCLILNIFYSSFYTIAQPPTLRSRNHSKALVNKTSHLNNSDFLIRLLYKYSY